MTPKNEIRFQRLSLTVVPYFCLRVAPLIGQKWPWSMAHGQKNKRIYGAYMNNGYNLTAYANRPMLLSQHPSFNSQVLTRSSTNQKLQDFLKDESEIGQKLGP